MTNQTDQSSSASVTRAATLGQLLFSAGVGATIVCGAKAPAQGEAWPSTLPIFIVASLVAILGIILWRKAIAVQKERGLIGGTDAVDPAKLLRELRGPLSALRAEASQLDTTTLMQRVDALLDEYILPIGEARQGLIDRFGMEKGAEILVTLAFGERMLNRVWSAAADGHLPEALSSLEESADALQEAADSLP